MSGNDLLSLEELGQTIHDEVNERFQDRAMPTESVSENFIHQIVLSILEDLRDEGKIPFIPEFKTLNKTSLEERFADNIPDFSKHINLVGLDKEKAYDEFGVMNVAFDGDDAQRYTEHAEAQAERSRSEPEESESRDESSPDEGSEDTDGVEIPDYLTVIEGGKSKK